MCRSRLMASVGRFVNVTIGFNALVGAGVGEIAITCHLQHCPSRWCKVQRMSCSIEPLFFRCCSPRSALKCEERSWAHRCSLLMHSIVPWYCTGRCSYCCSMHGSFSLRLDTSPLMSAGHVLVLSSPYLDIMGTSGSKIQISTHSPDVWLFRSS